MILRFLQSSSVLFFIILSSCSAPETNPDGTIKDTRILPPASGTHSELLLVMPDELWVGAAGQAFRDLYLADQEGLPQSESYFDASRVEPKDVNRILQKTKSIMWVEKSDTSFVKMQKDLWARPQRIVRVTAQSEKQLVEEIKGSAKQVIDAFKEHDMSVIQGRLRKSAYAYTHENLKKIGIRNMLLHKGFDPTLDKENLKIFATKTVKTIQYIMVSERPMTEGMVSVDDIIAHRDSIGKKYFEGTHVDSYMETELLIPPFTETTEISGMFALETRGLWRMENDFMGGPFLSYTIYDEKNNRILTVESLLYGPTAKKRNVVLEMEAMMRSIIL
ncbi:DUF4837 family protein [Schleiferiaceae bacterium]|nr:hypothetical protein [Flavobacteriales bacterium]MDC1021989.1 DUF4837 family protein [Schleiferiaceae bacterium]|tara:strand:+ start:2940 stop:3938 length:999 start_codon:yes stop_codon:yes gene_type:complete